MFILLAGKEALQFWGKKKKKARSGFSFLFSLLVLSSALLLCPYQLFPQKNFRETCLTPLSLELLRHLRAIGTNPSYYKNTYLKLDCDAFFHKQ